MGAEQFSTQALGIDADTAFTKARDEALWDSGHGGYTGTIAEKHDFILIPRPNRVTAQEVLGTIIKAEWASEFRADGYHDQDGDKAWKRLVDWYGKEDAREYVLGFRDKWGPCLAIEGSDAETKAAKARHETMRPYMTKYDRNGRVIGKKMLGPSDRGMKVYVFFGVASS